MGQPYYPQPTDYGQFIATERKKARTEAIESAEAYIEAAQDREIFPADIVSAFVEGMLAIGVSPEDEQIERVRSAGSIEEQRKVIDEILAEEVPQEFQAVVAQTIDQTARARAEERWKVVGEQTQAPNPWWIRPFIGTGGRREHSLDVSAVEAELDRRISGVEPGSNEAEMRDRWLAEGPGEPERRELPFIGGYPGATTVLDPSAPVFEPRGFNYRDARIPQDLVESQGFRKAAALVGVDEGYLGDFTRPGAAQLRYHEGDQWILGSYDPNHIAYYKRKLVKAGYLHPDDATGGMDSPAVSGPEGAAMSQLMDDSNGLGTPWTVHLDYVAANPSEAAKNKARGSGERQGRIFTRAPFQTPAYLGPDMDTIKQDVKRLLRTELRREPTAAEMRKFIGEMDEDYRSEFDVQVAAARAEYASQTAALESQFQEQEAILDEGGRVSEQVGPAASGSPGSFRAVDPSARFAESFEKHFANELSLIKRRDNVQERQSLASAAMARMDGMFGRPQGVE